jgi:hypothetical protein
MNGGGGEHGIQVLAHLVLLDEEVFDVVERFPSAKPKPQHPYVVVIGFLGPIKSQSIMGSDEHHAHDDERDFGQDMAWNNQRQKKRYPQGPE